MRGNSVVACFEKTLIVWPPRAFQNEFRLMFSPLFECICDALTLALKLHLA
jgi:hypothetical protein